MSARDNEGTPRNPAMGNAMRDAGATGRVGLGEQPQAAAASQQQQQHGGGQPRGIGGMMDFTHRLQSPMHRTSAGEALTRYMETIKEIFATEGLFDKGYNLLQVDSQVRSTNMSAILITGAMSNGGRTALAVHALPIEASCGRLQNRSFPVPNGPNVEVITVPADAMNEYMWQKIEQVVAETGYNGAAIDAGYNVIPSELAYDARARLRAMVFYAIQAVNTMVDNALGGVREPFRASWFGKGDRLTARPDYAPQGVETAAGLPRRADVSIIVTGSNNQGADPMHAVSMDIARVDGYVEPVYVGQPQMAWGHNPNPADAKVFVPRFVITGNSPMLNAVTPELELLSLGSSALLSQNMAWAGVFRARRNDENGLRNIGALGLELPMLTQSTDGKGAVIDTTPSVFGNEQLIKLIHTTFIDKLAISIDVEEGGDMSWLHACYREAGNGNADAIQFIVEAADTLTDGHFSRCFQALNGQGIVYNDQNRIHLGYYTSSTGERRDIRDIDYLAMLNHIGRYDMSAVTEWTNTFDQVTTPLEVRLEKRFKLLEQVLGTGNVKVKSYAWRLTYTPEFIGALSQALFQAGLVIAPATYMNDFQVGVPRGNSHIANLGVNPAVAGAMFVQQQPFAQVRTGLTGGTSFWSRQR